MASPAAVTVSSRGHHSWVSIYLGVPCRHSHLSATAATVCGRKRRRDPDYDAEVREG